MRNLIYFSLILVLFGFISFGEGFIGLRLKASASVGSWIEGFFNEQALAEKLKELERENEDLKSQLFLQGLMTKGKFKVYSIYPFNNVKELAIAAGRREGVEMGNIVTHGKNILIGRVSKVFDNYSIVQTIYDPNWKMEVRIGGGQIDGLFTGGNSPTVTMVAKNSAVNVGDLVYTAAKGYPYGIEVGKVKQIKDELGSPLKEMTVLPPLELKDLRDVEIRG